MTDVNGDVTFAAPDPNAYAGQSPESPSRGTNGERSASLSDEERRNAGLLNDGDTIIPQVPHNDGFLGGKETEVVNANGSDKESPATKLERDFYHTEQAEVQ